jgi:iron(III) transport system ATP-binding protein
VEIATLTRDSGATAVYITHDQSEAFALADKIGVLDHGSLVQFDRPEQIYRRPATPFVARFTGVAGELTGQVVHHRDDIASVQVDDAVVGGRVIAPVRVGDMATVLIRPAASRITEMAAVGTTEQGVLHGAVVDVAYRGRGYDHVIAVGRHRVAAVYDSRARQRGEQVTVGLDAEHLLVYPEPDPPTPLEE